MDCIDIVLPFEEEILEAMTGVEILWHDLHHWSYFFPNLHEVESSLSGPYSTGSVHKILYPLATTQIFVEGNISNIWGTFSVNISRNPNVIKNIFIRVECFLEEIEIYTNIFKEFQDFFSWSYEEIHGIDPSIV